MSSYSRRPVTFLTLLTLVLCKSGAKRGSRPRPAAPSVVDRCCRFRLENALRHFAALTTGDVISIPYNDQIFEIEIVETKPSRAISIIETDVDVDFVPPKDYVEPTPVPRGSTLPSEAVQTEQDDQEEEDDEDMEDRPRFVSCAAQ